MKKIVKENLKKEGFFFHPGGDLPQEINNPKKRGIWISLQSPIKSKYIGQSWEEAQDYYDNLA